MASSFEVPSELVVVEVVVEDVVVVEVVDVDVVVDVPEDDEDNAKVDNVSVVALLLASESGTGMSVLSSLFLVSPCMLQSNDTWQVDGGYGVWVWVYDISTSIDINGFHDFMFNTMHY